MTLSGLNRNGRLGDSLIFAVPEHDVRDEFLLTKLTVNESISEIEYISQNIHHEMSRVKKKNAFKASGMVLF